MENTGKVLFDDPTPQWFISVGDNFMGPFSAADVYQKIQSGQITWAHYIWKEGQKDWERIYDVKTFQVALPKEPAAKPTVKPPAKKVQPPAPPKVSKVEREWFVFMNDSQYGPFSVEEILNSVTSGKLDASTFAWKDGMPNWQKLEEIAAFKSAAPQKSKAPPKPPTKSEQRGAPRKPLVARILLADQQSVSIAICRDISVGGMQVLTDVVPGTIGTKIRLNVSPSSDGNDASMQPFVAEGTIVRVLEDGRGFSFRFERLADSAKRAIENYIEES